MSLQVATTVIEQSDSPSVAEGDRVVAMTSPVEEFADQPDLAPTGELLEQIENSTGELPASCHKCH